jgi:hypothetical protein
MTISRRGFTARAPLLVGAAAAAELAMIRKARADQNFTSFAFKSTIGTTPRTDPDRWSDIINVKDFGATGNGSSDDAAAIQSAFDAAFGPASAPHDNGGGILNRPVYFPKGQYKILTPVRVTAVWGGRIFGDGPLSSTINYAGPLTPINAEGWIPTFWFNGFNYGEISNLSFSGPADPNHKTVCLWFGPDGAKGGSSVHGNLITNIGTGGRTSYGIIHGSLASAANSENTYLNCTVFGFHDVGLFLSGYNTLNFRWIGGGFEQCDIGIKTNAGATIPVIEGPAFGRCRIDIDLAASSRTVISGVRSESIQLLRCNTGVSLINCVMAAGSDTVTGSVSNATLTVTGLGARGNIVWPQSMVIGGNLPSMYNSQAYGQGVTRIVQQLSGPQGGIGTYEVTQSANVAPGTKLRIVPVFAELVGAASVSMDNCGSDSNQAILGDGNSTLHIRNNQWFSSNDGAMAPNLISAFNGQIFEYDIAGRGDFIVAHLPTPARALKGVRMFVTDSRVTTFGSIVTGGGTNAVPVWCDGTDWKVG